jgi:hypothetical protein
MVPDWYEYFVWVCVGLTLCLWLYLLYCHFYRS